MAVASLLLVAVSAQALPPATAVPPPETDTAAVLAPINAAFAAFEAGDAAGDAAPRLSGGPGNRDRQRAPAAAAFDSRSWTAVRSSA